MVRVESDMKEKIVPNMEPLFLSYERHKCLCGFLTMQHFSSEDFAKELRYLPEENKFYHGLCYLGLYQNIGVDDFSAWLDNARSAISALAEACGLEFENNVEKELYAWGLAARSFPFDEWHSAFPVDEEVLHSFMEMQIDTKEKVWAFYNFGTAALDKMEFTRGEQRDASLFIQLMKKTLDAKTDYETLKKIHYDMEKGGIVYGE